MQQSFNMEQTNYAIQNLKDTKTTVREHELDQILVTEENTLCANMFCFFSFRLMP